MKYFTRLTVLVLPIAAVFLTISIAGCGATLEEKQAYRNAKTMKRIEIPPGLTMPRGEESLEIPEQTATEIATVDELEKPPRIISSVDLKLLDDNSAKATDTKKSAQENKEKLSSDNQSNDDVASLPPLAGPLKIQLSKNDNDDKLLEVDAEFDQVWPRVKPALIELGFNIDDASRGNEVYAISKELPTLNVFDKPVHPGDEKPEVKEEYQIHVNPSDGQTHITVHNKLGQLEGSGLAEHLLLQIKQLMENPESKPVDSDSNSDG